MQLTPYDVEAFLIGDVCTIRPQMTSHMIDESLETSREVLRHRKGDMVHEVRKLVKDFEMDSFAVRSIAKRKNAIFASVHREREWHSS